MRGAGGGARRGGRSRERRKGRSGEKGKDEEGYEGEDEGRKQSHLKVRVGRLDSNTSDFLFKKRIPCRDGHPKACSLPSCLPLTSILTHACLHALDPRLPGDGMEPSSSPTSAPSLGTLQSEHQVLSALCQCPEHFYVFPQCQNLLNNKFICYLSLVDFHSPSVIL